MYCDLCAVTMFSLISSFIFLFFFFFFFQAEDGIRDLTVTGVQTCALPIFTDPNCTPASGETMQYAYGFKSRHPGGVQFCMADGSVRFVTQNINHVMYQSLGGRDEGNPLTDF